MKFNVSSTPLLQQLTAVSKVINSKNTIKILDNFLLKVVGDKLYITGSDTENRMTACVDIMEADGDGEIAVPAKRLLEILKVVQGQALTFYINDDNYEIDIQFLNGHFNFTGVNPLDYPVKAPQESDAARIVIPASVVLKGIENTIFAVALDTIRPIMTGIYWDIHNEDITFVSSDTHKLVRYINSSVKPGLEKSFIMPAKPANILRSVIGKDETDVVLTVDSKTATFELGTVTLTCQMIKGNYPNYNRVIPTGNPFDLTIDRVSLLTALRRVAISASLSSSLVKFAIEQNEILLSAQDLDYATSAEERMMCDYSGNTMTIGFNSSYMIELMQNMKDDTVIIKLADPSHPGVIVPADDEENESILMLIMPMQVVE